jgi:hypothetical protein
MKGICEGKWKEPVERIRSLRAQGDNVQSGQIVVEFE